MIIQDSKEVDRSKLDSQKAYLQITALEPYFSPEELEDEKLTYFQCNCVLSKFFFMTPFTMDGRTQGAFDEQYIRKTVLTVDDTFPSLLKRNPVTTKHEIEFTPIENAIEAMQKMNSKLQAEVKRSPPIMKSLQGLLQGSILAVVNEGPIEFCQKFLVGTEDNPNSKYPIEHVQKLREILKEYLLICRAALDLNKQLIGTDQIDFHQALEKGLKKLKKRMKDYLEGKVIVGVVTDEAQKEPLEKDRRRLSRASHSSFKLVSSSAPVSPDLRNEKELVKKAKHSKNATVGRRKHKDEVVNQLTSQKPALETTESRKSRRSFEQLPLTSANPLRKNLQKEFDEAPLTTDMEHREKGNNSIRSNDEKTRKTDYLVSSSNQNPSPMAKPSAIHRNATDSVPSDSKADNGSSPSVSTSFSSSLGSSYMIKSSPITNGTIEKERILLTSPLSSIPLISTEEAITTTTNSNPPIELMSNMPPPPPPIELDDEWLALEEEMNLKRKYEEEEERLRKEEEDLLKEEEEFQSQLYRSTSFYSTGSEAEQNPPDYNNFKGKGDSDTETMSQTEDELYSEGQETMQGSTSATTEEQLAEVST